MPAGAGMTVFRREAAHTPDNYFKQRLPAPPIRTALPMLLAPPPRSGYSYDQPVASPLYFHAGNAGVSKQDRDASFRLLLEIPAFAGMTAFRSEAVNNKGTPHFKRQSPYLFDHTSYMGSPLLLEPLWCQAPSFKA